MISTTLNWSPKFSIGHDKIDAQHEHLFKLLAQIQRQAYCPDQRGLVKQSLAALFDYTQRHFRDEEELMLKIGYPDYTLHSVQHDKLLNQVEDMMDNFRDGEIVAVNELLLFLTDWLVEHIVGEDLAFSKYMGESSVE